MFAYGFRGASMCSAKGDASLKLVSKVWGWDVRPVIFGLDCCSYPSAGIVSMLLKFKLGKNEASLSKF